MVIKTVVKFINQFRTRKKGAPAGGYCFPIFNGLDSFFLQESPIFFLQKNYGFL